MRAHRLLVPALILALGVERRSAAASTAVATPPVSLDTAGCPEVPGAVLRRMISAELGTALLQDDPFRSDVTRVFVRCTGGVFRLELQDPVTGKSLSRQLEVTAGAASDASTRLLALSAVELISASWIELAVERQRPVPGVITTLVPPPPPQRAAARELATRHLVSRSSWRFSLLGAGRLFLDGSMRSLGGSVMIDRIWREALVVSSDLTVDTVDRKTTLGTVRVQFMSVALGLSLRQPVGSLSIEAGAGARVGVVRQQGLPSAADVQGSSFTLPWWGPFTSLRLVLQPWSRLSLAACAELGTTVREVIGNVEGSAVVEVRGPWVSALVGAGVTFD